MGAKSVTPGQLSFMERVFENDQELNASLVEHILSIYASRTMSGSHAFNLALSGGSVLSALTNPSFTSNPSVHYTDWNIYFADERCVDSSDPESNIGTAMRMWEGTGIRRASWVDIRTLDEALLPDRMDVTILGMGPDGHTASLFPLKESFLKSLESTRRLVKVSDSPKPPVCRVSMSLHYLNYSNNTVFVVKGKEKTVALQKVRNSDRSLPASHV